MSTQPISMQNDREAALRERLAHCHYYNEDGERDDEIARLEAALGAYEAESKLATLNYDELRKEDWVLDEILKGIEVRWDVASQMDARNDLTEEKKREVRAKTDAENTHGWHCIYELYSPLQKVIEAAPQPEGSVDMDAIERDLDEWLSDGDVKALCESLLTEIRRLRSEAATARKDVLQKAKQRIEFIGPVTNGAERDMKQECIKRIRALIEESEDTNGKG